MSLKGQCYNGWNLLMLLHALLFGGGNHSACFIINQLLVEKFD